MKMILKTTLLAHRLGASLGWEGGSNTWILDYWSRNSSGYGCSIGTDISRSRYSSLNFGFAKNLSEK